MERAMQADYREAVRREVLSSLAETIRSARAGGLDVMAEARAKFPGVPAAVISEAERMLDLSEAAAWWRAIESERAGQ